METAGRTEAAAAVAVLCSGCCMVRGLIRCSTVCTFPSSISLVAGAALNTGYCAPRAGSATEHTGRETNKQRSGQQRGNIRNQEEERETCSHAPTCTQSRLGQELKSKENGKLKETINVNGGKYVTQTGAGV